MKNAVLTIATGKPLYLRMAVNLARSFMLWNGDGEIPFVLATDRPDLIPADLRGVHVRRIERGEYGEGFAPKLHLDRISPADRTLFVDADCLFYGRATPLFERFRGHPVSAIGTRVGEGEWFGDIATRCKAFGVDALPKFVGAVYYLERGQRSSSVFETARRLKRHYDEMEMVRLRGHPNEEPLISLAMALHHQRPIADDGTLKADAMHFTDRIDVDVFSGKALFVNRNGTSLTTSPGLDRAEPVIAHFNDSFAHRIPYVREAKRLELRLGRGWPGPIADAWAGLTRALPRTGERMMKDLLRPLYRRVFGIRAVRANPRL